MFGKKTIISFLLPAYILLLLHAIIPHHHHYGSSEDPLQFHHELDFEHEGQLTHHDDHDAECCAKTHHFAHSPEKGEAMIKSGVKRIAFQFSKVPPGYLLELACHDTYEAKFNSQFKDNNHSHFKNRHNVSAHTLRGPPRSLSMA